MTAALTLVLATGLCLAMAASAWRQRPAAGSTSLALLMVAVATWAVGYALEISAVGLEAKLWWAQAQYLGIVITPLAWLLFAFHYSEHDRWLTSKVLVALFVMPVTTLACVWTGWARSWFWTTIALDERLGVLRLTHGPWFWAHSGFSYLALAVASGQLAITLGRSLPAYRWQALALGVGAAAPILSNVLYLAGLSPVPGLDLTPFAFTVTGIAFSWGTLRLRLLDVVPIAHEALFEGLSEGVVVLNESGQVLAMNPRAGSLLGREQARADLIGTSFRDLPEGPALADASPGERRVETLGNPPRRIECRVANLHDRHGRTRGRILTLDDVTEAERRTAHLARQRDRLDMALTASNLATWEAEVTTGRVVLDEGWAGIIGEEQRARITTVAELLELAPPRDRERLLKAAIDAIRGAAPHYREEHQVRNSDGRWRWVETHGKVVETDAQGRALRLIGVGRDITERKLTEQALIEARDEAQRASAAKDLFLATVSHELRTPLNGILGFSNLLLDSPLDPRQREFGEIVRASGETLLSLVERILEVSRRGESALAATPFFVPACFEEAVDHVAPAAAAKGLDLALSVESAAGRRVIGDPTRLREIATNLLANAVKFTESGGVLAHVRAQDAEGTLAVVLEVSDTGIGIAPENQARIFEAFEQVDASLGRRYGGAGLGLAIAREACESMRGGLSVESELGKGSTFSATVRLDLDPEPANSSPDVRLNGRDVLLVGLAGPTRSALERQLRAWGGLPLSVADEAEAARAAGRNFAFGITTVPSRSLPGAPIPWISLVAAEAPPPVSGGVELRRPVRPSRLSRAIRSTLGEPAPRARELAAPAPVPAVPLKILIAEDNAANQMVAVEILRRLGYSADVVDSGEQALEALAAKRYDLVLVDIQMPGMNGFEVARAVQARFGADRPRLVALTAAAMERDRERGREAGFDDYLTKPLRSERLAAALASGGRAGHGGADPSPPILETANLRQLGGGARGAAFLRDWVGLFLRDTVKSLADLRQAFEANDLEAVRRVTHAVRGSAATIGGLALSAACEEMGTLASGPGLLDPGLLARLESQYALLREALEGEIAGVNPAHEKSRDSP